jgi:hypothetical protein
MQGCILKLKGTNYNNVLACCSRSQSYIWFTFLAIQTPLCAEKTDLSNDVNPVVITVKVHAKSVKSMKNEFEKVQIEIQFAIDVEFNGEAQF